MKSIDNFSYIKGTELRNLLFHVLPAHLNSHLPVNTYSHFLLFTCGIYLFHTGNIIGPGTCTIAEALLRKFHQDHDIFFNGLKTFKLHLHSHLSAIYQNYGALSYLGCFGQESFIGFVSKNYHQVRNYGDAITYFFNVDFMLHRSQAEESKEDGVFDQTTRSSTDFPSIIEFHSRICRCGRIGRCCILFRRCIINQQIFHSLLFVRRQTSVSYFVTYSGMDDVPSIRFGVIECYFICCSKSYAVIKHHRTRHKASDFVKFSCYYELLKKPLDRLYYVLENVSDQIDIIEVSRIMNHCIVVDKVDYLFVSIVLSYHEHD